MAVREGKNFHIIANMVADKCKLPLKLRTDYAEKRSPI